MIPFILAAVGGYLIADSAKSDANKMADGGIVESDVVKGAKFKNSSGTIFIVDKVENGIVDSSFEGGQKGNYRDGLEDFVDFMNEEKVIKYANGGGVGDDLELLKNKIRTISKKMKYDGESGYGGYVVYLNGNKIQISNYSDLAPYSAQATDTEVKVSFNAPNKTMVTFSNRVNERFEDNKSFEKYGGIKYIFEPLTYKIASEILEKVLSEKYAKGGGVGNIKKTVRFVDKVEAIADSLEGKKVPKRLQNEYGKRYNRDEAEQAGRRIAGSMMIKSKKYE